MERILATTAVAGGDEPSRSPEVRADQNNGEQTEYYNPSDKPIYYEGRRVSESELDALSDRGLTGGISYIADDSPAGGCIVVTKVPGSGGDCPD